MLSVGSDVRDMCNTTPPVDLYSLIRMILLSSNVNMLVIQQALVSCQSQVPGTVSVFLMAQFVACNV